ncbi:MAG: hypothetical protein WAT84_01200 [Candidatus Moraniibacteriota bacterium]
MNHKSLFLTVALIALLVIAGAFWCIQNRPPMTVNQPVVETPVQVEPQAEPGVNPDTYPQHIETIPGNADEVWYNIPELGIRMKLNREFAEDLVYFPDGDSVYADAYFSTKLLMEIDSMNCSARTAPLGFIYRQSGTIEDAAYHRELPWDYVNLEKLGFIRRFPGFFVEYTGPQAACYDERKLSETQRASLMQIEGLYRAIGVDIVDALK